MTTRLIRNTLPKPDDLGMGRERRSHPATGKGEGMKEIGIGSTVWFFDGNHRVYEKDANGRSTGGAIYREYWVPKIIDGESKVSWIVRAGHGKNFGETKLPKKMFTQPFERRGGMEGRWFAITEQEVESDCWANNHRYRIKDAINKCSVDALMKVAEIVGYKQP